MAVVSSPERNVSGKRPVRYPGIRTTADGSDAVVWVESHLSQAACLHAVTPANRMAERYEREAAKGRRNLWDEPLGVYHAESAYGAASMCEGFALAGGRSTVFTGGQGLLQMAEVLFTAAGKRLPMVFHAAAVSLASQAITIQAGHDDITSVCDCGWGMVIARNAQEAADLAVISRRAAELAETPFLNVQDGFITTHGFETVWLPEPELMKVFVGAPERRVRNLFNPKQPLVISPLENDDAYMRGRIAQRFFYERVRPSLETAMADFAELTGRQYSHLRCYRMEDAEYALMSAGSITETAEAAVEHLRARGVRVGAVGLTTMRPFPAGELVDAVARCRGVTVIERTDTPLSCANPLTQQLEAALAKGQMGEDTRLLRVPEVYSGSAGLGGRAVSPAALVSAIENMRCNGRRFFVLGIKHPDALTSGPDIDVRPAGASTLRIHSRAGLGSGSTARLIAAVASDLLDVEVRVEASYRGEERVVPANSCVTLSPRKVAANADAPVVDAVAVHHLEAFHYSDPLSGLRAGGTLFVEADVGVHDVWNSLPVTVRRALRERGIDLFALNASEIASQTASSPARAERARSLALLGAFLKVTPFRDPNKVSDEMLFQGIESALTRFFEHHGGAVVAEDLAIARRGFEEVRLVVPHDQIADYQTPAPRKPRRNGFKPAVDSDIIPAGFCDHVIQSYLDGRESVLDSDLYIARSVLPAGSAALRSFRKLAPSIPRFSAKDCTGCMECVNLCPDSAIVARVVESETIDHAPIEIHAHFAFTTKYYENYLKRGESGGLFGLYIDADRCKGCGECVEVCGSKHALEMVAKTQTDLDLLDRARDFFVGLPDTPDRFIGEKSVGDILLSARARIHTGGAGSCMGCGGSTALRMMLAATGYLYGADQMGVVSASGCQTAADSTYPFSPAKVSWTNTLASNAPAEAIGIRLKWNRDGNQERRLWVIGSEDALIDAGLHTLTTLLDSGLDINVLVLHKGSRNPVGDLGVPLLMRRNVLVAQTTAALVNHFYKSVVAANEFPGPSVVICYSGCTNDHGISDDSASAQAKLAVETRAFPLFLSDPRMGDRFRDRLDLRGNPALRHDWYTDPNTLEPIDFITYAQSEGRFRRHFDGAGEPGPKLQSLRLAALANWRHLQELGGLR